MENKEMEKGEFYKYLSELDKLSNAQLIIVKSVIEGLLKNNGYNNGLLGGLTYPTITVPNWSNVNKNIPNCCKNCPNFKEGAICNCTLPYLEQQRTNGEYHRDYNEVNVPPLTVKTTSNTSDLNIPNNIVTSC